MRLEGLGCHEMKQERWENCVETCKAQLQVLKLDLF